MVSLKRLSEFIKMDKIDLANYYCSAEEVEVDEAMMAGPRKDAMKKKEYRSHRKEQR